MLGIALAMAAGFGAGLLGGIVLGEWLGAVHPERVRRILKGRATPEAVDPSQVEREILRALKNTSATRRLTLSARALAATSRSSAASAPRRRRTSRSMLRGVCAIR